MEARKQWSLMGRQIASIDYYFLSLAMIESREKNAPEPISG